MTDPVDLIDGLATGDAVSKSDTRAELKAVVRAFPDANAVRAVDLSGRTRIMVGEHFFRKDTGSVTADNGITVIRDYAGNAWVIVADPGVSKRKQVRVATTANITIATALNNGDSLNGVTLATNDLVLVKDQTTKSQNGVYVVGVTPARHTDFDTYDEHAGALIAVTSGSVDANSLWFCSANLGGILDTTDIEFTKIEVTSDVPGAPGDPGADGADGTDPGILLTFDGDTADSDQGSGKVWLDNATLTSATVLYISKTNRAGSDIAAKLARLDDSSNPSPKAEGTLTRNSDGAQLTFAIGAVTDATGYVKIAISGVAGAASFTAADAISFQAERIGDAGSGLANIVEDTTPQLGGTLDTNGKQIRWSKGADVASGSALTLGDDGNYFDITGTTTVMSIATKAAGTVVKLHFDAALILTHHATDLVLPGSTNITTAAGDEAEFVEYATGDWRCTSYIRSSPSTAFSDIKQAATTAATGVVELATDAETITGTDTARAVTPSNLTGASIFGNIPQNSQSAAYTLVASDQSKHIFHPSADTTARIWTIPANSSVAFPIGTTITFINQNAAGVITIAITTDTMRLAGAGTTGSRTLAANGIATAVKVTTTEWIISGTGLT